MQKNVLAYVIFCERAGHLHLHCAFADSPSSGKALIALLRTAYDKLQKEPDRFSGFSVTTVNSFSEKLVHSLLEGTMANDSGPTMLLPYETGGAFALVAIHTEGAIFDPETTTEFLSTFTEQVKRIQAELHQTYHA